MDETQLSVATDAVLKVTAGQRNAALDENAQLRALVQQLVDERDELAAENKRLRAAGPGA
ncbi:hypothetical protein [Nonomuraea rhodomycinica]|uniref:Uncharacterized protein n=1 Tax=Nonomuraea rhodomycinica TaxID=1712872 RepID=A0A7Y6IWB9_9ACTN|nr:hypothetical protein [Nonomuraea rhodomycinica]NUW45535.1 hypothetical protein [Nonomuraea rhodomycinica]